MGTSTSAPGALGAAETTYVTAADVMALLGCQKNTAYKAVREINKMVGRGQSK